MAAGDASGVAKNPEWVGVLEAPAQKSLESLGEASPGARAKAARELETMRQLRDSVQTRILQEKRDATNGPVQQIDRAEAGEDKQTIVGRLFGREQERAARVAVNPVSRDIAPLMSGQQSATYDPYFVQSEAEKVKSQLVLGGVVDELKLDQKWGEADGRKLTRNEAIERLRKAVTVDSLKDSSLLEIRARGEKGAEAADIANKVAEVYQKQVASNRAATSPGLLALAKQVEDQEKRIAEKEAELQRLAEVERVDVAARKPVSNAAVPQPEVLTAENAFSTFSLNVSDVSFKLAGASLEKGLMPDAATVRSEEFINAFDYRDAEPQGAPVGFVWERARYPFAQDRDLVRFSVKTAASGRALNRPMNIVLLIDSSGSMERSDRVRILQECMRTLAAQLKAKDVVSVVSFARTPRLWVDGMPGTMASELPKRVGSLNPEGGTNLEEALKVAYETARKHFSADGVNRVVLLTDGAANLGDVEPESLKAKVEAERKRGIALDCFGIGWEGLNDELLETLSRNGDGRYGFVNSTEAAGSEFAGQLAGALKVAASDVKVQVEWNPKRVTAYRQIGYAKHQLTKEQFRDNTVDAAEIGAAEAGNALYTVQVNAAGEGPLGTVRVRFKNPGTNDYREHAWTLDYDGAAKSLENSSYPLRLAGTASAFSEWLVSSPYASEVTTDRLLSILSGVPEHFAPDPRPKKLEWMIRQAKSVAGR
jgi:Mg-chelatase subunit ChlD